MASEAADRAMRSKRAGSVYLETERLILRRLNDGDVDDLYALDSDPEVMRYLNDGRTHTREEIATRVLPHYLDHYARYGDRYGFWAAIEKGSGAFIGWFHFRPYRPAPEEIALGYRLIRSAWGKHYATEGSRALIEKGFTEFGVRKVVADTLVGNVRSRRVMEALGMRVEEESTLAPDEFPDWNDVERRWVKYAIARPEWLARRAIG
jgi:RimJ/RimL family protein N-acetyltransferase